MPALKNGSGTGCLALRWQGLLDPKERQGKKAAKKQRTTERTDEKTPASASGAAIDHQQVVFIECFAGEGALTKAMLRLGFQADVPQDLDKGGVDFEKEEEVVALWRRWDSLRAAGFQLVFHMAPPCCSFSAVRDRSRRTRLRSRQHPEGLDPDEPRTASGNNIAKHTALSIRYLVRELGAKGSLEQPVRSYMVPFLEQLGLLEEHDEIVLDQCRYGRPYKKPTSFLAFGGLDLEPLGRVCRNMECGNKFHVRLGFGEGSTSAAAAYSPKLAAAYAGAVARSFSLEPDPSTAIDRLTISGEGLLVRHVDRGRTEASAKAQREAEDLASKAGARNAYQVIEQWPAYVETMTPIKDLILKEVRKNPELQGLARACGESPERSPPSLAAVAKLRLKIGRLLGLSKSKTQATHAASPWRYELVRAVQGRAMDPDTHVADWLQHGAPFGIAKVIEPGGLLPLVTERASLSAEQLEELDSYDKNHGSFNEEIEGEQPALGELQELVDQGFARIFKDTKAAEEWLQAKPIVSPLGNVVKLRPDATRKNRLIQDFRASRVNEASVVHERQVLPRFADHAHDLATLAAFGSSVGVFILDFKHAFMTIPLAREEMPYNTSVVPGRITRTRTALDSAEPTSGELLVWRVLGFGGHANPLVYARVASFACRSGQALLFGQPEHSEVAHARIQLYVDDPAVTLFGTPTQQVEATDILILWWLVLGIPLSWKKGSFRPASETHTWIGVDFVVRAGQAIISLPEEFLGGLLALARKFADPEVKIASLKEAQEICGRAGRVGQVVPEAKPFVSSFYGALAGSLRALEGKSREAPPGKVATRFCDGR